MPEEGVPLTWTTLFASRILASISTVLVRGLISRYREAATDFFGRWGVGEGGTINKQNILDCAVKFLP